ncbi:MAG: hypothetical protein JXQ99_17290 [Hyphomicrobiaceae bacterium]
MTGESMIDYEALAQEAMRNVVRSVLIEAAEKGLPGDHHFYISFDTLAPGVILSKRLREKYAEEMTIVLQHRFWDLIINEHRFEVKLTFDGIPERLVVPFKAIRVFFDPSVRYGLQFESVASAMEAQSEAAASLDDTFDDPFADRDFKEPAQAPAPRERDAPPMRPVPEIAPVEALRPKPSVADDDAADLSEPLVDSSDVIDGEPEEDDNVGAEIVSLDAFRKK